MPNPSHYLIPTFKNNTTELMMATTSTVPRFPNPISSTSTSTSTPKPPQLHFKAHNAPSFSQQISQNSLTLTLRREVLLKGLAAAAAGAVLPLLKAPPSFAAKEVEVGSYLPTLPSDPSFVLFKASPKDTPALRAGNVQPYQFILPPTWKQLRIANILSGNYCQPKCAEPWVEVKFEDESQGKVQVVASPLIRLTNKPNSSIEEIGSPEKLIASLGPFVTGNTYDPDELLETSVQKLGDQTYYKYVLETPFALTGSHNLAKATAKGNTVVLFVASANDKQWKASEKTLRAMLDSFQPYQFILPPTWKQLRIANILSGNYCQPKCAEPWVEVKFKDENQGKVQVMASPLIRLTNKSNSLTEEIGSPEKLIASLGPFVTGNSYDPNELLETSVEKLGGQTEKKLEIGHG